MRPLIVFTSLLVCSVTFSGCLVDMLASTAIESTVAAKEASTMKNTLDHVKNTTSDLGVNQAIQAFRAENGRNPASLQELVPEWLPSLPMKPDGKPYGYDPQTGQLLEAPMLPPLVPGGVTDAQKMQQIRDALNKYGATTGYYPATLDQLVPALLPSVPKTVDGQDFIYIKENGGLIAPTPLNPSSQTPYGGQPAARPRPAGGGGAGPMGEALTGIGISNELDNMSSAGSSAAGSRARGNAGAIGEQHNQQQEQALNNLGL